MSTEAEQKVDTRRRVKVYDCNDESGTWDDRGTGQVTCEYSQSHGLSLKVVSEDGRGIILDTPVYHEVAYQRQQVTLIVWTDPKTSADIALSFQDGAGCEDLWNRICRYQGRVPDEETEFLITGVQDESGAFGRETAPLDLPEPELKNLNEICETLTNVTPQNRDSLVAGLLKNNFVQKLLQLFNDCEDLEDVESLGTIHKIVKTMVFLNDNALYELLFNEENLVNVIGTFEYDPVMRMHNVKHRDFLLNKSRFRKVVQIKNPAVEAKIHQNFRLQYLKDVVLPRLLDDQTFTTINSIIYYNNVAIVQQLATSQSFMDEMFEKLKNPETQEDAFSFLQELCGLARSLQQSQRAAFFHALCEHGLLDMLELAIADKRPKLRIACMDVLTHMVTHDTSFTRKVLYNQPNYTLLKMLVKHLVSDTDTGVQEQLKEVIRCLLDPETMDTAPEKDEFLNAFYDHCIDTLTAPVVSPDATFAQYSSVVKDHVCELLRFCVQHHGFRIKYYILRHNIAQKMLRLVTPQTERFLVVSAIRVLRAFVGMKDDFYDRYILKQNLFAPVLTVFFANGSRYNLLNSVVLEMLSFIRQENRVDLIKYTVQLGGERLKDVDYVDTVQQLLQRYAQNEDAAANPSQQSTTPSQSTALQGRRRADSDSDSEYFKESDNEDENQPMPNLVDYGSDEDNGPPPLSRTLKHARDDDDDELRPIPRKRVSSPPLPGSPSALGNTAGTTGDTDVDSQRKRLKA